MGDSLSQVAVSADDEGVVVGQAGSESGSQISFCHRHAYGVGEPLAQGTCGDLNARCVSHLRMPRRGRTPLPEVPYVIECQTVAGQVEHGVEEDRGVSCREDEPVPVGPRRVRRVIGEDPGPEDVGQRGQGHGRSLVAGTRCVRSVHGEAADNVDGKCFQRGIEGRSVGPGVRHGPTSASAPMGQRASSSTGTITAASVLVGDRGRRVRTQTRVGCAQQERRGSEAVQVVSSSHRSDLSGAVHARHARRLQPVHEEARIVPGVAEEMASPAISGEDQGALRPVVVEPGCQVPTRRIGIPDLELEGGSDLDPGIDGNRTRIAVGTQHSPDQEVARTEGRPVLVDHYPHVESVVRTFPIGIGQGGQDLPDSSEGGLPAKGQD